MFNELIYKLLRVFLNFVHFALNHSLAKQTHDIKQALPFILFV